jgi:hypothetical protein
MISKWAFIKAVDVVLPALGPLAVVLPNHGRAVPQDVCSRSLVASVWRYRWAWASFTPDFLNTAASVRSAIPITARFDVWPFQKK